MFNTSLTTPLGDLPLVGDEERLTAIQLPGLHRLPGPLTPPSRSPERSSAARVLRRRPHELRPRADAFGRSLRPRGRNPLPIVVPCHRLRGRARPEARSAEPGGQAAGSSDCSCRRLLNRHSRAAPPGEPPGARRGAPSVDAPAARGPAAKRPEPALLLLVCEIGEPASVVGDVACAFDRDRGAPEAHDVSPVFELDRPECHGRGQVGEEGPQPDRG